MAYTTLALVRQYGNYDPADTFQDAEISALIPQAQAKIDSYTKNTFEASAVSTRYFDAIDQVRGQVLLFDQWLASTTDLVVTNGDSAVIASTEFVTLPLNRSPYFGLRLKSSSSVSWTYDTTPENAIDIEGYWAYAQTVPDDVALACIQLVLHWLRMEDQAMPKDMPDDIVMLLMPYTRTIGWS